MESDTSKYELATVGGGCFWCIEAVFNRLQGVEFAESGYSGGRSANPSYEEVCTGRSGHVEVVQIRYDPAQISFEDLLEVLFTIHDPTTLNRQGNDVGEQYRSVIFWHDENQRDRAQAFLQRVASRYDRPVVTAVEPLVNYYPAEDYHQRYFDHNPGQGYCLFVVAPKVSKAERVFANRLKPGVAGS